MWNEGWAPASHLAMARAKEAGLQMKAVAHAWAIGIVCGKAMETCEIAGMLIEAQGQAGSTGEKSAIVEQPIHPRAKVLSVTSVANHVS